ncbi:MAG: CotH kinase family protein [bacterium]|nr:CotH kinase family protein [bacterium]
MRWLLSLLLLGLLTGCQVAQQEEAPEKEQTEANETAAGDYVEKETLKEGGLRDNDAWYAEDDETSVVTMYLTVCEGNEGDNTDHTWDEINAHSAYYYEENNLERYNVDAILQIGDENGVLGSEFGEGVTVPNAAVQIRGQTSSLRTQKNYKIRIKDGKGKWREQRTLALNKHVADASRIRNKLAYDLMKEIPQMMSARTQFVHLYVKDQAGGDTEFVDYGLFTQVEQINKTYLENHGLDRNGHLYKINFFEWEKYDAVMKQKTDPDYDEKEFETYLEIKGTDDHTKLHRLLEELNDYTIPITEIVEAHFDVENLSYWMAFHMLMGNFDVGARNAYIYSPLNSEKWYFISWDNDVSLSRGYYERRNYSEGDSWEKGMTKYVGCVLFNRMLREEIYREALDAAVEDLMKHYLTEEKVDAMIQSYAEVVRPYLFREPDLSHIDLTEEMFEELIRGMAAEIRGNYEGYIESLEKPWPFFVYQVELVEEELWIGWGAAYDLDGEEITYHVQVASDYWFEDVLYEEEGVRIPQIVMQALPAGRYFIRVRARNESGYEQDCFDYCSVNGAGKIYGARCFVIEEDGSCSMYEESLAYEEPKNISADR